MPHKVFKELGFSESMLDPIFISTACSNSNKAAGFFQHKIYLQAENKKFYSLPVNFLVLGPEGGLEKCLLGIPDLRQSKFCLDGSKPEKGEMITLTVHNMVGKEFRKSFNTTYWETHWLKETMHTF